MPYKDAEQARVAARERKRKQRDMSHPNHVTPEMSREKPGEVAKKPEKDLKFGCGLPFGKNVQAKGRMR